MGLPRPKRGQTRPFSMSQSNSSNFRKPKVDGRETYRRTVKTDNASRLRLIDEMIEFLNQSDPPVDLDYYDLYLILDEAITNSMEHGNRWGPEKRIHVTVWPVAEEMLITIKDEGVGFNPDLVRHDPGDLTKLSPRGRGIFIIKKFCQVSWNSIGNEITLRLPLVVK